MATEDYPLYVHWYKTLSWIMDSAERLPKKVRFSIAMRIMDLSLEILELIIEAIYQKERSVTLKKINLNLEKLRVLFRFCFERRYLSIKQYEYISRALNEAGKMTGGWIKQD
jgi:flagellar biosynthesis/type III secretory pathway protein FliH